MIMLTMITRGIKRLYQNVAITDIHTLSHLILRKNPLLYLPPQHVEVFISRSLCEEVKPNMKFTA